MVQPSPILIHSQEYNVNHGYQCKQFLPATHRLHTNQLSEQDLNWLDPESHKQEFQKYYSRAT